MVYFLYAMMALAFGGMLFSIFMLIRNNTIFNIRIKMIDLVYPTVNHRITINHHNKSLFDRSDYDVMMWQFSKWTFDSFYPTAQK